MNNGKYPAVQGVEFIPVYRVLGEYDQNEGRGGQYIVGYTMDRSEAAKMAMGHGCMGQSGGVESAEAIRFPNGEVFVIGPRIDKVWQKHVLREQAKAKLTPEELDALLEGA